MSGNRWQQFRQWFRDGPAIPVLVAVLILAITVAFWGLLEDQQDQHIQERVEAQSAIITNHIEDEIDTHFKTLDRMANRWEYQGRPSYQQWHMDAMLNLVDFDGFYSIQWMNRDHQVEWAAPASVSEVARSFDHTAVPARFDALSSAEQTTRPIVTPPVTLAHGAHGFVVYRPVFVNDDTAQFDGFIIGTFVADDLFEEITRHRSFSGYSVEILNQGEQVYLSSGDGAGPESEWAVAHRASLAGRPWQVSAWPTDAELDRLDSHLPLVALVVGSIAAVLCGLLLHLTGVARRKSAEAHAVSAELDGMVHALERSNSELEEFAYVASHDLKAPLVSLRGMADILSEDYREHLPDDARMYIDRITFNAGKMQQLLDDLLQMSRLRATDTPFTPVDLNDVVATVVRQLQQEITTRGAEVRVRNSLPVVAGNPMWLNQAFLNLIDNALKYVPADRSPVIRVEARRQEDAVEVRVRDNGDGIPVEYHDRIFSMFHRLPNGKSANPGGSGMGLAIVARVAELHNGSARIELTDEDGTTFVLTFPMHELVNNPDDRTAVSVSGSYRALNMAGE